jgi:hypothetical protein
VVPQHGSVLEFVSAQCGERGSCCSGACCNTHRAHRGKGCGAVQLYTARGVGRFCVRQESARMVCTHVQRPCMLVRAGVGRVAANPQRMKSLAQEECTYPLWTTFHCCCSIRLAGSMCMCGAVLADGTWAGSRVPIPRSAPPTFASCLAGFALVLVHCLVFGTCLRFEVCSQLVEVTQLSDWPCQSVLGSAL